MGTAHEGASVLKEPEDPMPEEQKEEMAIRLVRTEHAMRERLAFIVLRVFW